MAEKSYNLMALRGMSVDDREVQDQVRKAGISVPDELLYTPEFPRYIIQASYNKNLETLPNQINDLSGQKYTEEEAMAEATTNRSQALDNLDELLRK